MISDSTIDLICPKEIVSPKQNVVLNCKSVEGIKYDSNQAKTNDRKIKKNRDFVAAIHS